MALLRSCLTHEVPPQIFQQRFLPTVMRQATVEKEAFPYLGEPVEEIVSIHGAQSIVVFFDDVQLLPGKSHSRTS